jgi:hypothetical protein
MPESHIHSLAVSHQSRIDFRQWLARGQRLSTRLHDGHDAVDLQPDAFPSGTLYKTRTLTGRPDLCAGSLILGRCGCHGHRHPKDEQSDPAKWYPHLAHRLRS